MHNSNLTLEVKTRTFKDSCKSNEELLKLFDCSINKEWLDHTLEPVVVTFCLHDFIAKLTKACSGADDYDYEILSRLRSQAEKLLRVYQFGY